VKAIARPFGRTTVGDGYVAAEVAAGVTQLRSRTSSCHCYLFRGPRRTVLVDTGLPSTAEALVRALAGVGVTPGDIDQVILTHEHIDHLGGVASFAPRAEVLAHRLTAVKVELRDEFGLMTAPFGETITPFPVAAQLEGGELIATGQHALRIHPSPGHSSGSLSLHDENSGLLVAGDLVLQQGALGGIFVGGSPSDSVDSLRRLARLKPRLMLPGHGPLVTDPPASLARAIENCGQLIAQSRTQFAALDAASSAGRMVTLFQEFNRRWRPV
jgi:glyoxylase-like metal-dependent hydrolase (beta-lactamase superfamily II)